MLGADDALHRLPSAAIKRLRGREVALVAERHREVIAARERVRMIRPERLFARREALLIERECLGVFAARVQ